MFKISTILMLAASLYAMDSSTAVLEFSKQQFKNAGIEYRDLKVLKVEEFDSGWKAVTISFSAKDKEGFVDTEETIVANGEYIVSDAYNVERKTTVREMIAQDISDAYIDKNIIFSNGNGANKVVIFSDPFCHFCKEEIKNIESKLAGKKDYAVYLVEVPLIYKASETMVRMLESSKDKKEATLKVYKSDRHNEVAESQDFEAISKWFFDTTGENMSKESAFSKEATDALNKNLELANKLKIQETPSFYINGKIITSRSWQSVL